MEPPIRAVSTGELEHRLIERGFTHWKCDQCGKLTEFFKDIESGSQHAKGCVKPQEFHGVRVE